MTRTRLLSVLLASLALLCILLPGTMSSSSPRNRPAPISPHLAAGGTASGNLRTWPKLNDGRSALGDDRASATSPASDPPYSQSAILTQATGIAGNQLGTIVSIDDAGDTVALIVNGFPGGVVVFEKQGATWVDTLEINPPVVDFIAAASVAISGDGKTIVVGTCWNATCLGKALVYEKPGATWTGATLTAMLSPSDPLSGARFGIAVAIDQVGDAIAVGAPCESTAPNTGSEICGAVYVYARPSGSWAGVNSTETAKLTVGLSLVPVCPTIPTTGQEFNEVPMLGFAVAIDSAGNVITAGAPDQIHCASNGGGTQIFVQGAGYVFLKPSSGP
jgi:FG-GAP repeat